jgi:NitT/TauT family transport system substrate-binding protein
MKRAAMIGLLISFIIAPISAFAADTVVVAMGKTSSNLPYYVAQERGYFTEFGIAPEQKIIIDNSLVITALISDQAEAAMSVLAIDGMNANLKKTRCRQLDLHQRAERPAQDGTVHDPHRLPREIGG